MCTKTKFLLVIFCVLGVFSASAQHTYPPQQALWDADSLGTQRAVLMVNGKDKLVKAVIPWRNQHVVPEQQMIVVDSLTNQRIDPSAYVSIGKEEGVILFEAISGPGIYYVYYLPYRLGGRSKYYPDAIYLKRESSSNGGIEKADKIKSEAKVLRLEAVDSFNSNDPMEVIATQEETKGLINAHSGEMYLAFPEERSFPIRMNNHLPKRWIDPRRRNNQVSGEAKRGEYYAFQIGVWPIKSDLRDVRISCSSLKDATGAVIDANAFDCLNTEGVSYTGDKMNMQVNVPIERIQAFWCGVKIPEKTKAGIYEGTLTIRAANAPAKEIKIRLNISQAIALNGGINEPWKMTRLPWLNSTLAQENTVIKPYLPLQIIGDTSIALLGRKVVLATNGFPKQIQTFFTPEMTGIGEKANDLLFEPIHFHFQKQGDKKDINFKTAGFSFSEKGAGTVAWQSLNTSNEMQMEVNASLEFDGFLSYTVKVIALQDVMLQDIAMHIPYKQDMATYIMGLGLKGGYRPERVSWKWDVAAKNQDGAWLGNVNAGMQFSLRDEKYSRPLNTNFYLQKPLLLPSSWGNENKGGIDIGMKGSSMLVNSYSGARTMKKGDTLYYNFNLLITPFHPLNTDAQWNDRYFHAYQPVDSVKKSGANVINIHHGNALNPYINYPFIATKEMKSYIDAAHHLGLKVKIYNTVREVSNRLYELYPLRSLGYEVFSKGPGKGYSWLQEHLHEDYIAAWFVPYYKDAAIINSGMNRWHNYYVEGMNWLVDNVGIDGIYLDDVAFDRVTMKRIKRVMTKGGHPGLIDLHSANQYNERDGFNNSANLYLEHFPYINRLWFGEYFDYENNNPDFFLTEVSGIPFGLMGEMLQDGGNPWRGMVYGMTNRLPYQKSGPQGLWRVWDEFGLKGSNMIGYWVKDNPVKANRKDVLTTIYKKEGKVMVSLASWANEDVKVDLVVDWEKLGIDPTKANIQAPAIDGFQAAQHVKINEPIHVAKNKGCLLIIQ